MIFVMVCYVGLLCAGATIIYGALSDGWGGVKNSLASVADVREWWDAPVEWWMWCAFPAGLMAASQAVFLWPVAMRRPERRADGRPLLTTILAAALVAAVLTVGLGASLLDVYVMSTQSDEVEDAYDTVLGPRGAIPLEWIPLIMVGMSWIFWSYVLWLFAKRRLDDGRLGRVVGLLLGSTVAEIAVVLPIDLMVRRRTECYCATGSFVSICMSIWALLWLAGPGVVLALTSKRRRFWRETHCASCGHPKGPSPAARCPECGASWSSA